MEILPTDLGQWRTVTLMRLRATMTSTQASGYAAANVTAAGLAVARRAVTPPGVIPALGLSSSPQPQKMGFWTRFWAGGTGLEPDAARQAVGGMNGLVGGLAGGLGGSSLGFFAPGLVAAFTGTDPAFGIIFSAMGVAMAGTGLLLPRYLMTRYTRKPLRVFEVEALRDASEDLTEKAYLNVVAEVLRQPELPDAQTAHEVRAALQTLGAVIDQLPRPAAPHQNADDLRRAAQKAWTEADAEPDAIIAASLRRRAEAQEKTAQAAQKNALLVRRSAALRSEIEAQIEALRMGLSGFDANLADTAQNHAAAQNAAAHLSQLAASVQSVAREAGSLTDARNEVAAWVNAQAVSPLSPRRTEPAGTASEMVLVGGGGSAR